VRPLDTTGWTLQRYKLDKDGNPVPTMTGGVSAIVFDRNGEGLVSTVIKPGQENKNIIAEMGEYLASQNAKGTPTNANPDFPMQEALQNIVREAAGEPPLPPAPRERWTQASLARYQKENAAAQAADVQAQNAKNALQQAFSPARYRDIYDAFAEDMANPNYNKRPFDVRDPEYANYVESAFINWAARELVDPAEQQLARQAQEAANAAANAKARVQTRLNEVSKGTTLYSGFGAAALGAGAGLVGMALTAPEADAQAQANGEPAPMNAMDVIMPAALGAGAAAALPLAVRRAMQAGAQRAKKNVPMSVSEFIRQVERRPMAGPNDIAYMGVGLAGGIGLGTAATEFVHDSAMREFAQRDLYAQDVAEEEWLAQIEERQRMLQAQLDAKANDPYAYYSPR
jgi:hypothetical protein